MVLMNQIETIGADLGGTKLAVGVVDGQPKTVWNNEVPSIGYSQEAVIDLLAEQINLAHEARPDSRAAGIGIPATIDFERGYAVSTVNLDLADLPVRELVTERVGLPVVIDNDANVAMLAEALFGAAKGARNAIMMTLGTGIGGGVWLNGEIFRGSSGAGAELGHTVVDIDGPRCRETARAGAASSVTPPVPRSAGKAGKPRKRIPTRLSAVSPPPVRRSGDARSPKPPGKVTTRRWPSSIRSVITSATPSSRYATSFSPR